MEQLALFDRRAVDRRIRWLTLSQRSVANE
jgi:hypothetical protein